MVPDKISKVFLNGEYGSSVCLHPGKRLSNNARVYLPNHVYPERTHADVLAAAMEADSTRSCVQGIFRASPFASTLDVVASIPIAEVEIRIKC